MNMAEQEFKNLFRNKILLISVIAITLIPILYASIFDKSVWDPYGRSGDLPVAVVNQDRPVEFMGERIAIGDQMVDNLKANKNLDWHFVNEEEADRGMKDLQYYMVITITEDFSENAKSMINKDPKEMEIIYSTNGSLNYIAQDISQVAVSDLDAKVREQVVESYVEATVKVGQKVVGGLEEAGDGAGKLANGTKEYTNGVAEADGGAGQLAAGIKQLDSNVGIMVSGVSQLDGGANELSGALNKIDSSVSPIKKNIAATDKDIKSIAKDADNLSKDLMIFENSLNPNSKTELERSIRIIENEIKTLVDNHTLVENIAQGSEEVSEKAAEMSQSISNLNIDMTRVGSDIEASLETILSSTSLTPAEKDTIIAQIKTEVNDIVDEQLSEAKTEIVLDAKELSLKAHELETISNDIETVTGTIATSADNIRTNIDDIKSKLTPLETAASKLNSNKAGSISKSLENISKDLNVTAEYIPLVVSGVDKLSSGSSRLSQGLDQMKEKMPDLSTGISELDDGAQKLNSGLSELDSKSAELTSGAEELATSLESAAKAGESLKFSQKNVDQFAAPTKLTLDEYSKVANYGEALAPYIMSLALFVGSMLFNFIYPIRKISKKGGTSKEWWFSKLLLGFGVSSVMALIQATVMLIIGLEVGNLAQFYLTAFTTAWAYMAITMFLAMTFDNPGRFIAMILLVLQLGGAGGTFPIQLQSGFYKAIHPFLPMSYSIYGFKEGITGGIGIPMFTKSIIILIVLAIVFTVLLRYSMKRLQRKHLEDVSELNDNQKLQGLEI